MIINATVQIPVKVMCTQCNQELRAKIPTEKVISCPTCGLKVRIELPLGQPSIPDLSNLITPKFRPKPIGS